MPGPNDYHISKDGTLLPGLGKDEPTEEQLDGVRAAGRTALNKIKAELKAHEAELTEKERKLLEKEQDIARREAILLAAEKKAAKPAKGEAETPAP